MTCLVLIDVNAQLASGIAPIEVDILKVGRCRHDFCDFLGDGSNLRQVFSAHAVLNRPADGRSQFQREKSYRSAGKIFIKGFLQARPHAFPGLGVFCHDDSLRKEVVLKLFIKRQIKTNGTPSNIGTPMIDIRIVF